MKKLCVILFLIIFVVHSFGQTTFYDSLSKAALELTKHPVDYDPSYFKIAYPNWTKHNAENSVKPPLRKWRRGCLRKRSKERRSEYTRKTQAKKAVRYAGGGRLAM